MDMGMKKKTRMGGRRRSAFSLVEVLLTIVIVAVALGAVLSVFSQSLLLTIESSNISKAMLKAYGQAQKIFFAENLSSPPSGIHVAPAGKAVDLAFSFDGKTFASLSLQGYDVGERQSRQALRVYRTTRTL